MYTDNPTNNIRLLLPPRKRTAFMSFLAPVIKPLTDLWQSFLSYVAQVSDKININYQVNSLEYGLNRKFNNGNSGIYISDAASLDSTFIFRKIENRKLYIYSKSEAHSPTRYFYRLQDYQAESEFIVNVPNTLTFNQTEMRAYINQYKVAGFRFTIITY